jgi:AraC family transcriptional regulator of adaptative response / DNA-3-methyladenine glycosylase II
LISEGALDESSVEDLADRVGIGSRQLRRLFVEHLGASPVKIAITHRVHFARNLIEETDLPITKIALSAGFTSIRQFNHAVRAICGQSPTELRRALGDFSKSPHGGLVIRLPYRRPLDWAALVGFLRLRATPGVEQVEGCAYQRTISIGGVIGIIDVRPDHTEPVLAVRIELPSYQYLMKVVERVRRIFDLGADPLRIADDLSSDQKLKPLFERRPGLRVPGVWDGFELAVHAILGQQMTVGGSTTTAGRLVRTFGKTLQTSIQGLTHLFPTPEDLVHADLSKVGIHGARAATLHALARAVSNGELTFAASMTLEEAISRICRIRGIRENTAQYIAMRAFGEPDAFPFADPGLRSSLDNGANTNSTAEVLKLAERWRPWRAYAAMHLCGAVTAGHEDKVACKVRNYQLRV